MALPGILCTSQAIAVCPGADSVTRRTSFASQLPFNSRKRTNLRWYVALGYRLSYFVVTCTAPSTRGSRSGTATGAFWCTYLATLLQPCAGCSAPPLGPGMGRNLGCAHFSAHSCPGGGCSRLISPPYRAHGGSKVTSQALRGTGQSQRNQETIISTSPAE